MFGPAQPLDEETFYLRCRAVYISEFRSSLTSITSKQHLCRVLQLSGRNPSLKTLSKYWTPATSSLNFDDFCEILKLEKQTDENELLRIFKGMDVNGDGFISHSELEKALTTSGEKMTAEEVNAIFSIADANKDSQLDYAEFCRMLATTAEQCQAEALVRLEADAKMRRQNFGSQIDGNPKSGTSSSAPPSAATPTTTTTTTTTTTLPQPPSQSQRQESDPALKKESRTPSRVSSARSRRPSLSPTSVTMSASTAKASGKTLEPAALQNWQHGGVRGCFFLEEEGSISSLQYRLHLPRPSSVYLSIQPRSPGHHTPDAGPSRSWVDTALFVTSAGQSKEECNLVCFTEARDEERYVWRGELAAGSYFLVPFTSGCRLRRRSRTATPTKPQPLVYRTDSGGLDLTRELREALSDIFDVIDLDGNGLISLEEYNLFELRTSGEKCDEEAWAICKETFDTRRNQLTRQGFMELHLMEATEKDGDPSDLWLTLEAMGYNQALELVEACPFQVDVHCEGCPPSLQPLSLDWGPRLLNQALQKSIVASVGEARALRGHDNVLVYTYRGDHRISSLVANKGNQKVTVHVNNEHSKNCCSSRGMSVFAVEVPAKTKMVHQHVLPINESQEWTYCCVEGTLPSQ